MSNCSFGWGLVNKLTTTVIIKAIGSASTIESTVGHGAVAIRTDLPVSAWQIPSASADFLYSNASQKRLIAVPITRPEITPALVERFQNNAKAYIERNAAAVILNQIEVPTAIMFAGKNKSQNNSYYNCNSYSCSCNYTEDFPLVPVTVSYISLPKAVPCTWNCAESVDIAAESSVIMNRYVNQRGIAAVMNAGIILSALPPATCMAIFQRYQRSKHWKAPLQ